MEGGGNKTKKRGYGRITRTRKTIGEKGDMKTRERGKERPPIPLNFSTKDGVFGGK